MHIQNNSFKSILCMLLALTCLWLTFPDVTFAAQGGTITISNISLPSTKLSKGDSFSLSFNFYASTDFTTPKNLTVSGEAIDNSEATYHLSPADSDWSEGQTISAGCIVTVNYSNLIYTGTGSDGKISIELDGANASKNFTLSTLTADDVEGALLLDTSATSNLSGTMNAGESKKFSLQIKNVTNETIKNGVAKIYFNETTTGLSISSGQYTNLSSINSGATAKLNFTISASSAVKSGTYLLTIELNNMKQTFNLSVASGVTPPTIEVSTNANQTFTAGEINFLSLNVKNSGGKAAKNLKLEVTNEADLAVVGSSNVKYIDNLEASSSTSYTMKLQLDSNLSSNLVLLKLKLTYSDPSGENYTDTQSIYLNTNSVASTNNLQIVSVKGPSGTFSPNQNFTVQFGITSTNGAEDVKITVKGDDNIVPTSQSVFILSSLAAKATKNYSVTLTGTDKVTTSTHPIEILLEYEYGGKSFTMSQYTSVNIINPDEEEDDDLTNPKVILNSCNVTPSVVAAGGEVTLDLSFLNTHASKSIYNLSACLNLTSSSNNNSSSSTDSSNNAGSSNNTDSSSSNGANLSDTFSIQDGTSSLFTAKLAPGACHAGSLVLLTSNSASPQTYNLELVLSYEDEDGKDLTSTATIPVTISQDISLDIAQIDLSTLSIGRSTALTATIYNTSKADISQVMMYLESDSIDSGFTVTDNKSYLASFSMGATEYYAPTLTGVATGTYDVNLVIEYEDSLGQVQTMRYPFAVTVADNNNRGMQMQDGNAGTKSLKQGMPAGIRDDASSNALSVKVIIFIAVGVAAGAVILVRFLKKRKQKKEDAQYND